MAYWDNFLGAFGNSALDTYTELEEEKRRKAREEREIAAEERAAENQRILDEARQKARDAENRRKGVTTVSLPSGAPTSGSGIKVSKGGAITGMPSTPGAGTGITKGPGGSVTIAGATTGGGIGGPGTAKITPPKISDSEHFSALQSAWAAANPALARQYGQDAEAAKVQEDLQSLYAAGTEGNKLVAFMNKVDPDTKYTYERTDDGRHRFLIDGKEHGTFDRLSDVVYGELTSRVTGDPAAARSMMEHLDRREDRANRLAQDANFKQQMADIRRDTLAFQRELGEAQKRRDVQAAEETQMKLDAVIAVGQARLSGDGMAYFEAIEHARTLPGLQDYMMGERSEKVTITNEYGEEQQVVRNVKYDRASEDLLEYLPTKGDLMPEQVALAEQAVIAGASPQQVMTVLSNSMEGDANLAASTRYGLPNFQTLAQRMGDLASVASNPITARQKSPGNIRSALDKLAKWKPSKPTTDNGLPPGARQTGIGIVYD